MGLTMRKRVPGPMRTAGTHISLCMCAVLPGPSLSANRIIGYYRMYEWRAKARMILSECARLCESAHFAHARRHLFV